MISSITPVQIRFADIDWMGHVNNATYITYLETARLNHFKEVGTQIDWRKVGFILGRTEINYVMPVLLDDQLFVKTWCTRIGNKSFDLFYSIFKRQNDQEIEMANALTVLVCYDYENKKSVLMPSEWKKFLE